MLRKGSHILDSLTLFIEIGRAIAISDPFPAFHLQFPFFPNFSIDKSFSAYSFYFAARLGLAYRKTITIVVDGLVSAGAAVSGKLPLKLKNVRLLGAIGPLDWTLRSLRTIRRHRCHFL